jgi:hypothetical protein
MLFRQHHLAGIKSGKISLAFRKWKKPAVRQGSLIKTAIGQLEILSVRKTSIDDISAQDALDAGFKSRDELLEILDTVSEGDIHRIELRYHSPDPRLEIRSQRNLTDEAFLQLKNKLERLDRYSKDGDWTIEVLESIRDNPKLKAKYLSAKLGKEKDGFKLNVRKLKNLGLTISHEEGYTLSPLGEKFLEMFSG